MTMYDWRSGDVFWGGTEGIQGMRYILAYSECLFKCGSEYMKMMQLSDTDEGWPTSYFMMTSIVFLAK